jgi:hypothetical protein
MSKMSVQVVSKLNNLAAILFIGQASIGKFGDVFVPAAEPQERKHPRIFLTILRTSRQPVNQLLMTSVCTAQA